jgi:glycosyltransferase involved in cell wall biosynthesis
MIDFGGAERLVFEEATHLARLGWTTTILTLRLDDRVRFGGAYRQEISVLPVPWRLGKLGAFLGAQLLLLLWLIRRRPALVIAHSASVSASLRLPALLTRTRYITRINGTIMWFESDLMKYSLRHREVASSILRSAPFSKEFISERPPKASPLVRVAAELEANLFTAGVRGATRRISFSRRMAWEVTQLYGVPAEELKGAFPRSALDYRPSGDPLARFRISGGPVILNVNRLEPRKRVALAIRAFALVADRGPDLSLVIGGRGPSEAELHALVRELHLDGRVSFAGFIPESELPNWLGACEVFIHPNWADFAIAPYEALALGKKVVWSSEMETDPDVAATGLVFAADPVPEAMAAKLWDAIVAKPPLGDVRGRLAGYSWETYFAKLSDLIATEVSARVP